jgi:hypothetical protein
MHNSAETLVARIDADRPFEFDRHEVLPQWIAGANERLAQRRTHIPVLDALASQAGISEITALDQLVPLLLSHTSYKSYPRALLDKGRWDGMTRWLNTLSTESIEGLDVAGATTQDQWVAALAEGGYPVYATSGTSGKSSFLPATPGDRALSMRCLLRTLMWQYGLAPDGSNAFVLLSSSDGSSRATEYFRRVAQSYGDPQRTWFLTDEPVRLQDLSRMAVLSKAMADGTAAPNEIAAFEQDLAERKKRVDEDWDRLADIVTGLAGQRVIVQGFWAQQWTLVERLRARGFNELPLDPHSVLAVGGGTKGVAMPPDFEHQVRTFYGLDESRQSDGYGMSELSASMPAVDGRYRLQPWIIPLILNEEGTELVEAESGQHEGRFAFFDLALEGRWGGLVSGDRVIADFDTPAVTIVPGSVARYSDLRGGEDDRLTCAGTVDAFVRGFEREIAG